MSLIACRSACQTTICSDRCDSFTGGRPIRDQRLNRTNRARESSSSTRESWRTTPPRIPRNIKPKRTIRSFPRASHDQLLRHKELGSKSCDTVNARRRSTVDARNACASDSRITCLGRTAYITSAFRTSVATERVFLRQTFNGTVESNSIDLSRSSDVCDKTSQVTLPFTVSLHTIFTFQRKRYFLTKGRESIDTIIDCKNITRAETDTDDTKNKYTTPLKDHRTPTKILRLKIINGNRLNVRKSKAK